MASVLFLQSIWVEFIGTMSLISYLRERGHQADIRIGNVRTLVRQVEERAPDIVAFSVVTGYHHWALETAAAVKASASRRALTVFGGPHPTFFPEIIEKAQVDVICRGEGEEALAELADSVHEPERRQQIGNIWFKRDGAVIENPLRALLPDLDALPFPARDGFYRYAHIRNNPVKRFMSSRGCPHACSFCFNHSYRKLYEGKGRYIRKRSPRHMLDELLEVKRQYPMKTVWFEDDLFGFSSPWLMEFLPLYREQVGLPFICAFRADQINESIVAELKKSNCYTVVMGLETGSERLRNEVLMKNITDEQLRRATRLLRQYRVNFCTTNILGLPHETWADALQTLALNVQLKPRFVWCSIFQPYPRTKLGIEVVAAGLVRDLELDRLDANYHSHSVLQQQDIKLSENLHKLFYIAFKFPSTLPLIKWLCRFPPNRLFLVLHRMTFMVFIAKRWQVPLHRAILEGLRAGGFKQRKRSGAAS